MWGSQLESWIAFAQVQSFIVSIPDVPWESLPLYKELRRALVPLVRNLDYVLPQVQCICFWGYVKSAALILTPIVAWRIFKLAVDWQKWEHDIVHNLRPALVQKLAHWAAACVLAVAVALAVDCIDCASLSALDGGSDAHAAAARALSLHQHAAPELEAPDRRAAAAAADTAASLEMCREFESSGQCQAWRRLVVLEGLPRAAMGWIVALVGVNTVVLVVWLAITLLARYKNRKGHDAGFWFSLTGLIKKCGMVLISMSYLPICNILLDNVRPLNPAPGTPRYLEGFALCRLACCACAACPSRARVEGLTRWVGRSSESWRLKWGFATGGCMAADAAANRLCLDYPSGVAWMADPRYIMFIVSSVFAALYIVAIPAYLAHHVREAVSVLDRNNPRHVRLFAEVHTIERQRTWRSRLLAWLPACMLPLVAAEEGREQELMRKRLLVRANALYAEAVCDFDDARSALYCSYKWTNKYFKLVAIGERVLLLLLDFFLSDTALKLWVGHAAFEALGLHHLHLDKLLTAVVTALVLAGSLLRQPFSDWQDALIDGFWSALPPRPPLARLAFPS